MEKLTFQTETFDFERPQLRGVGGKLTEYSFKLKGKRIRSSASISRHDKVVDGDGILTNERAIDIRYTYPLRESVTFRFESETGFTMADFVACVRRGYQKIYWDEDHACGPTGTVSDKCMNRARSDGPYGIWGHAIEDLVLEYAGFDEEHKIYELGIGS